MLHLSKKNRILKSLRGVINYYELKNMKNFLLFIAAFLCFINLSAQRSQMGFYYNHTVALNDFADNTRTNMGGFMTNFLFSPFNNSNFAIGGEFGVSMYANEDYAYTVSEGASVGEFADVNQDDCFLQYALVGRYYLTDHSRFLRPYAEARVGGMTFFSTLTQGEECTVDYESETEYHGTALTTGGGLGLIFNINSCVMIDLNAAYNRSGVTSYRHLPPPEHLSFRLDLDDNMHETRTDNFAIKLGFLVQL